MKNTSIKKNFIMNAILTMSSFIFPLITFPYVSKILLTVGTGKVQFVTSVISYFNMFAHLGIPSYGVRAIAKVREDKEEMTRVAQELLIISLVTSVIAYIALFIALLIVPRFQDEKALFFIISSQILLSTIGMEWMYKGLEQYSYITIRSIIFKIVAMIMMFMFIHKQSDYIIYGFITIVASVGSNILNLINAKKYISFKPVGNYNFKRHKNSILTFFAMACATTIYTHLDSVMLGFMIDDAEVGIYHAAVKIKTLLVSIVTSLGTVLLPRSSYYIQHKQFDEFKKVSRKALNFVVIASLSLTIYFILFADKGIFLLTTKEFAGSIVPMQIIMPTLVFIGLTNIMGLQILVPLGREKVVLISEIVGAVVDLVINFLLIPTMKSSGAAIGTLAAEFAVLVVQYIAIRKDIQEQISSIQYKKIIFAISLSIVSSIWVRYMGWGNFLSLLVSGIIFFGIYLFILTITKETLTIEIENQLIGKLIKR